MVVAPAVSVSLIFMDIVWDWRLLRIAGVLDGPAFLIFSLAVIVLVWILELMGVAGEL